MKSKRNTLFARGVDGFGLGVLVSALLLMIVGSGCSSVWLERYLGVVEVASSNLVTPTIFSKIEIFF